MRRRTLLSILYTIHIVGLFFSLVGGIVMFIHENDEDLLVGSALFLSGIFASIALAVIFVVCLLVSIKTVVKEIRKNLDN